jgi:hypothetical protein
LASAALRAASALALASQIGTIAGLLAFMLVLLMELSLGFSGDAALSIIWLLLLFVGWGIRARLSFKRMSGS